MALLERSKADPGLTKLQLIIKQIQLGKKSPEDNLAEMAERLDAEGFFEEMERKRQEGVVDAVAVGV